MFVSCSIRKQELLEKSLQTTPGLLHPTRPASLGSPPISFRILLRMRCRPNSLIQLVEEMAFEDDAPMVLFSIARAFFDNISEGSDDLIEKANALKNPNVNDGPADTQILKKLKENKYSSDFLRGMSDEQIHWARKRLDSFKNAPAETMMVSPVNNNMFKVYDMFWDVKKDEFTSGAILFVGMPSSSISSVALSRPMLSQVVILFLNLTIRQKHVQG